MMSSPERTEQRPHRRRMVRKTSGFRDLSGGLKPLGAVCKALCVPVYDVKSDSFRPNYQYHPSHELKKMHMDDKNEVSRGVIAVVGTEKVDVREWFDDGDRLSTAGSRSSAKL